MSTDPPPSGPDGCPLPSSPDGPPLAFVQLALPGLGAPLPINASITFFKIIILKIIFYHYFKNLVIFITINNLFLNIFKYFVLTILLLLFFYTYYYYFINKLLIPKK